MEEKKNNTGPIIGTIAAVILCGCPGLAGACFGAISAIASFIPGAEFDILGSSDPQTALYTGIGALCAGTIFIAIPIVVGVLTLRKKKPQTATIPGSDEPLPPPN